MKKLVMVFGVALMGLALQAATCSWTGMGVTLNGSAAATDYTVYLIDSSVMSSSAMSTALADGDFSALTGGAVVHSGSGLAQGTTGMRWNMNGWGDFTTGASYTYYTVILNNSLAKATAFMITKDVTATAPSSGSINMAFGNQSSNTWTPVPEPTTGLLLLIGMAGLALRRKQA